MSAYHFDGPTDELVAGYDRLMAAFPATDAFVLHVCVERADGITVFDACPSYEDLVAFNDAGILREAARAAGLPPFRLEPLGVVHRTVIGAEAGA